MASRIIVLDTSILSLALQGLVARQTATSITEADRAENALQALTAIPPNQEVVIPALCHAELTARFQDTPDRAQYERGLFEVLARSIKGAPFDHRTVHVMHGMPVVRASNPSGGSRITTKVDILIAAVALHCGAAEIWVADDDFPAILDGVEGIVVRQLEDLPVVAPDSQGPGLFDGVDDEEESEQDGEEA